MFRFQRHSLAALALLAALSLNVEAGQASPLQRTNVFANTAMNQRTVSASTQQHANAVINSINAKKTIASGINPDG